MSDIENKRQFVLGLYPGPGWQQRVMKMGDAQVIAIYLREHNKPRNIAKPKESNDADPPPF